jgi:hypothetical protein
MSLIAKTPEPPYYAVIFTSHRTGDDNGYGQMAERMVELASKQPGFLGVESAREEVGITVSYWSDLASKGGRTILSIGKLRKWVLRNGTYHLRFV